MKKKPTYNPNAGPKLRMVDDLDLVVSGSYLGMAYFQIEQHEKGKEQDLSAPFLVAALIILVEFFSILALMHKLIFGTWINL